MSIALKIILHLAALSLAARGLRRIPSRVRAALWIAVPALLTPLWIHNAREHQWTWFFWAKVWSVAVGCAWFDLCAARPDTPPRLVSGVTRLILVTNILEATLHDGVSGRINVVSGLALAALVMLAPAPRVEAHGGRHEVAFDAGWMWIAGYTAWNAALVYQTFTFQAGQHLAVLGAPLLLALRDGPGSWLRHRATTLGLHLLLLASFYGPVCGWIETSHWSSARGDAALTVLSLAAAMAAVVARYRARGVAAPGGGRAPAWLRSDPSA